jgi:peroxiredoxin Q/BCP
MPVIPPGTPAPDFSLPESSGGRFRLADAKGRWLVLYFYPKDMTPGCTTEACEFRDLHHELAALGAVVVGVSGDPVSRHEKFKEKYHLPFPLLADEDFAVAKMYGAYGEKSFMGRKMEGILRTTYLIAPDGTVAEVWEKVKAAGHAAQVLEALRRRIG